METPDKTYTFYVLDPLIHSLGNLLYDITVKAAKEYKVTTVNVETRKVSLMPILVYPKDIPDNALEGIKEFVQEEFEKINWGDEVQKELMDGTEPNPENVVKNFELQCFEGDDEEYYHIVVFSKTCSVYANMDEWEYHLAHNLSNYQIYNRLLNYINSLPCVNKLNSRDKAEALKYADMLYQRCFDEDDAPESA